MKNIIKKAKKQGYSVYKVFGNKGEEFNWIYVSDYNNCIYIQKNDEGEYLVVAEIPSKNRTTDTGAGFEICSTYNSKEIDLNKCFEASRVKPPYYKIKGYRPATIEDIVKEDEALDWKIVAV